VCSGINATPTAAPVPWFVAGHLPDDLAGCACSATHAERAGGIALRE
jgi:hypothetical protein